MSIILALPVVSTFTFMFLVVEPVSPTTTSALQTGHVRVSLMRSIFSFLALDSGFPKTLRPRPSRKDTSEGLIAPRSPNINRSQMNAPIPSSPSLRPSVYPPPPRSPGPRFQELDLASTNNASSFQLDTPPRRVPARQDSLGLGINLRRTSSHMADDR